MELFFYHPSRKVAPPTIYLLEPDRDRDNDIVTQKSAVTQAFSMIKMSAVATELKFLLYVGHRIGLRFNT